MLVAYGQLHLRNQSRTPGMRNDRSMIIGDQREEKERKKEKKKERNKTEFASAERSLETAANACRFSECFQLSKAVNA